MMMSFARPQTNSSPSGQVAEIAGVQPAVANRLRRERVLLIVAQHHRRPGEQDLADVALRQRPAVLVRRSGAGGRAAREPQLTSATDGPPPSCGTATRRSVSASADRCSMRGRAAARRKRRREHVLGQAVAGQKAGVAEPGRREFLGEGRERRRDESARRRSRRRASATDRGRRDRILDAAHAQVVGEVRREADGAAMPRDRAQPLGRPLDERLRRQQHARAAPVYSAPSAMPTSPMS